MPLFTPPRVGALSLLFYLDAADMNTTADQPFLKNGSFNEWRMNSARIYNLSAGFCTAIGGVYTAPAKGGFSIVSPTQGYNLGALFGPDYGAILGATAASSGLRTETPILSLTTPHGSPFTSGYMIIGQIFS